MLQSGGNWLGQRKSRYCDSASRCVCVCVCVCLATLPAQQNTTAHSVTFNSSASQTNNSENQGPRAISRKKYVEKPA